jgi:hypothetical protein
MLDAIEVALETQPVRIRGFGKHPIAGTGGAGRARGEQRVEGVLTLLAPLRRATHETRGVAVRAPNL